MEKYLRDVMSDNKNGLYLCALPTGFGKTFTSVKLISEWIKENHSGRKIIFLTTLNKNLPEDELRDALGDAVYRQTVLRIRSNFDEVVEKLPELEISEQFQTESYQRLLQSIKQYIRAIRYEAGDRKYIIELENRVREAETGFRSMLTDHLRKVFPSKNARMEAIRHHADYRWMGKLYPAVFTDDYRVLMMSVNKFLTKNSVLTEPSYDFLKAPFIQNAIIFIDEFDATKATVKSEIIERSLGMKNDFLVLFRQLNRMLNTQHLSRKMRDSYAKIEEDKKARYTFSNLIKEADEIDEKYHTRLSYKTVESAIDRRQNFLLKDTSFHTVLQGGAKYIRAQVNRQQNVVDICFEDRKQHLANKQPDDIVIYSLIRDINRFLRHFKVFLFEWARHYCGLENNRRDSGRDRMTFENAVASIMDKLELSVPQRKLLMGELCEPLIWLKDEDIIPHVSFYQDGMEIFEFEDNDAHNDSTAINFVKVYDTPEKLLIYLARQSKVIGISATAEIPTVVGNYHLHYVEEVLGNRFHATPPEVKERIRRELEENNRAYQDGRISIYSKIVSTDYDGKEIDEICREITGETDIADMCAQLITNQSVDRYQSVRYCNAFRAMAAFFKQSTIQSMLYLGMALPKQNHPDFDKELMKKLMKLAAALCGCDTKKDYLVVLTGDNFDSQKEQLTSRLSNGEKLFIMSSYSTLGAGQNLQYEVTNPKDYIYLRPCGNPSDKRFLTRDIDAVYLGDTTNLTTNTYSEKQMKEKALMEMLFQIEELYNNGELSFSEKDKMMHLAFRTYSGGRESGNLLYRTDSVKMQATKYVIQAIGRMCRTFLKSSEIFIFAEKNLLDKISPYEITRRVTPPEMKALAQMCGSLSKEETADERRILNNAERVSSNGMQTILSLLSRSWTEHSMAVWRDLRETVLRYPTASEKTRLTNSTVKELYITGGKKLNRYLYSQYADFSNVILDFSNDEIGFRNSPRAKRKGDTDEVAVYHMNEEESGLTAALRYPGMKEYFQANSYALRFEEQEYLISPVLFHNIYKGALGEVCGEFILRQERGICLRPIEDAERFEFFDFEMGDGVYVDFKNWKLGYKTDRQKSLAEITRKLNTIGGKRVYIINLFHHFGEKPGVMDDNRIVEIPGLIDENGNVIREHLDWIKEEDDAADKQV